MTTPAGWYDDGSGRQRWWDGERWTDHFAPAAPSLPSTGQAATDASALRDASALDDTVARADSTAPAGDPYAPAPAVGYGAPSGGYGAPSGGYGAATPLGTDPGAPRPLSVLGLVGLGLAVLGTLLVIFPVTMIFGWLLLFAGLVVSIVSLFRRGRKWPGITGIGVSVLGSVVGVILFFVLLAVGITQTAIDLAESASPSPSSTDAGTASPSPDDSTSGGDRPTVDEVAVGITAVIAQTGDPTFTDEQITCFAQEFVDSDIPDDTLREIAETDGTFTDPDAAYEFGEKFAAAAGVCAF